MSKSLGVRRAHQVTLKKKAEGSQILHVRTFEYILNKRESLTSQPGLYYNHILILKTCLGTKTCTYSRLLF